MNITDLLLGDSGNNEAIARMAEMFGVDDKMARSVIGSLAPALSAGLGHHAKTEQGQNSILDALTKGNHSRYIEHPELLEQQETHDDGNAILEHVFGSKEVSRHTANRTAESTGLNDSVVKKMLPIVATMVMGSLGKKLLGGENGVNASRSRSKGLLNSFLDSDNDGSMLDDILGLAFKAIFR